MLNPTADIITRLQNVASILIPLLYWMAVATVVTATLTIRFIRYVTPIIHEHITRQMGWKVYGEVDFSRYFLDI